MPGKLLRRCWIPIAIRTLITFGLVRQEDRMAQNRQMLDCHPGILAVQLREFLPTLTTIAIVQAAFQRDMDIAILTRFDLKDIYIVDVQKY